MSSSTQHEPASGAAGKSAPVGAGIIAIDVDYVRPRMAASHLLIAQGKAAFIDVGTNHSIPTLLSTLTQYGLQREDVEHILLTHVHLDHAGGVGLLARELPRARVYVHPRGMPHVIDPSKLIAATQAVYGAERYAQLYGNLLPVAAARVQGVREGQRLTLGARTLEFWHTPGHALHHVCIVDRDASAVFTGDTMGLSYREFDSAQGEFAFVTCTPTQFDPAQLHASLERLAQLRPTCAYLTHYSRVNAVQRLIGDLHADIDALVAMAQRAAGAREPLTELREALFDHLSQRLERHGYAADAPTRHELLDMDVQLNADGLMAWLSRSVK